MIFTLIGVGLLIGAAVIFWIRRRSAAKQAASVSWPTCEGRVTAAFVHTFRDKDRNMNYMARVKFAYRVDGQDHMSERIAWGGRPTGRVANAAQETVARYPEGSGVCVYYDPKKPGEAVLEPTETYGLGILAWLWVGMAAIGVVFFVLGFFVTG